MRHADLSAVSVHARYEYGTQLGSTDHRALRMLLLCKCLAGKVLVHDGEGKGMGKAQRIIES